MATGDKVAFTSNILLGWLGLFSGTVCQTMADTGISGPCCSYDHHHCLSSRPCSAAVADWLASSIEGK